MQDNVSYYRGFYFANDSEQYSFSAWRKIEISQIWYDTIIDINNKVKYI